MSGAVKLRGRRFLRAPALPEGATPEKLFDTAILMLAQERLLRQAREREIERLSAEVERLRADLTALQVRVCRKENAVRELVMMERDVRIERAREAVRGPDQQLN